MRGAMLLPMMVALLSCVPKAGPSVGAGPPPPVVPAAAPVAAANPPEPPSKPKHNLAIALDPNKFNVQEHSEATTILVENSPERYLEFHALIGACSTDAIPKIGPITATVPSETQTYKDLTLHWFTQRSSVEHTALIGAGFYICTPEKTIVVRYVGAEENMVDAAATLHQFLETRKITVDREE